MEILRNWKNLAEKATYDSLGKPRYDEIELQNLVKRINKEIKKRGDRLQESLQIIIEILERTIEAGELKKAYEYISRINLDDIQDYNLFYEKLCKNCLS